MNLQITNITKRYRLTDQGHGPMDTRFTLFDREDDLVVYLTENEYKYVLEERSADACQMAVYAGLSRAPVPVGWDVV